ncbi:MAG: TetR/AcrR family transcriptional regulator [Nocardioides sp.]|nr:TetR/AcrR family transcriptional regulator [Nocardioides sp.]
MPRPPSATRKTILSTAMRMFITQGYDKTSLREIAEEVGVTKAALYYHFRTKDDIVRSAYADYLTQVTDLLDDAEQQPPGRERTEHVVDRLLELFAGDAALVLRFGQANPTVMSREEHDTEFMAIMPRLIALLAGPATDAERQIRALLSFGALLIGSLEGENADAMSKTSAAGPTSQLVGLIGTPEERQDAARRVALDLLRGASPGNDRK